MSCARSPWCESVASRTSCASCLSSSANVAGSPVPDSAWMPISVARFAMRCTCSEMSCTRNSPRPSDSTLWDEASTSSRRACRARSAAGSGPACGSGATRVIAAASSVESRWISRTEVCSDVASTKPRSACDVAVLRFADHGGELARHLAGGVSVLFVHEDATLDSMAQHVGHLAHLAVGQRGALPALGQMPAVDARLKCGELIAHPLELQQGA